MTFWFLAQTTPPTSLEPFFVGYGVLGVMFLLVLLGWLAPKWVIDEYRRREAVKDDLIKELGNAVERLATAAEKDLLLKQARTERQDRKP